MEVEDTNALIEKVHEDYDIEYGGFLSNHFIHGLIALHFLGANNTTVEKWYEAYKEHEILNSKLEPAVAAEKDLIITEENWELYIAQKKNFRNLYSFFLNEIKTKPLQSLVQKYMERLCVGVIGGAFHGFIHLGWALFYGKSETAIAEGFAYLTYVNYPSFHPSYLEIIEKRKEIPDEFTPHFQSPHMLRIYEDIQNDVTLNSKPWEEGDGFQTRVKNILYHLSDRIFKYASRWHPSNWSEDADTVATFDWNAQLSALLEALLQLFISCGSCDFFLLHNLTAANGLMYVVDYLENRLRIRVLWHFFYCSIVCYIAQRCQFIDESLLPCHHDDDNASNEFWDRLIPTALDDVCKLDEHIPKLLISCKMIESRYPNLSILCRTAASRCLSKKTLTF